MTVEETAGAVALGARVRRLRLAAEVGQRELGRLIDRAENYVARVEKGEFRVRRSTLEAMALWLIPVDEWPDADGPDEWRQHQLVEELVRIGGPAIAPERKWKR